MHLHVRPAALARAVPEVAGPAEEAREEVEGVVLLGAPAAALRLLPVLGQAVVPVLVVDAAGGGVREGVVGVGDGDEFGFGGVVAAVGGEERNELAFRLAFGNWPM